MLKSGRQFFKSIIVSSALVGTAFGSVVALRSGLQQAVTAGIFVGVAWGAIMVIFIGPLSLIATRKIGYERNYPEQSRKFKLSKSLPSTYEFLKITLSKLPFVHSILVNEKEGIISAKPVSHWFRLGRR